jgi:hypothetical protein
MQSTWSRFVTVTLVGGLCLAAYSVESNPASAAPLAKEDPLLTIFGWKHACLHCPNKNVGGWKG